MPLFQADLMTLMHWSHQNQNPEESALAALHRRPLTFTTDLKLLLLLLLLIYKTLNGLGLSYIANSLVRHLPSRTLLVYWNFSLKSSEKPGRQVFLTES